MLASTNSSTIASELRQFANASRKKTLRMVCVRVDNLFLQFLVDY